MIKKEDLDIDIEEFETTYAGMKNAQILRELFPDAS